MKVAAKIDPQSLGTKVREIILLAGEKSRSLARRWKEGDGAPVFTVQGRYTSRGWTEWTQGFQFGIPLIAGGLLGETDLVEYAERMIVEKMPVHLTHTGVHDHGFNNVSTFGMILRFMAQGKIAEEPWKRRYFELALRASGAVQASRWTALSDNLGYIYSFNGPHSLFADTIRSLRSLALAWQLGQELMEEQDSRVNLLARLLAHAETTARWNVYHGTGRDRWDERGRVAHESLFNTVNGSYRAPASQQGYSPFTTWTRGLAWIMLGFAEELEFIAGLEPHAIAGLGLSYFPTKDAAVARFETVTREVCDYYLTHTPLDGIPYWDTGGPRLHLIEHALERPADPLNPYEPVDSSAAAIAAQALLRFGKYLGDEGTTYLSAGLQIMERLASEPYLSTGAAHEGLLLHSVYHYPNAWDYGERADAPPRGESCMWGDYHLLEAAMWCEEWLRGEPHGNSEAETAGNTPLARALAKPSRFFDIAQP